MTERVKTFLSLYEKFKKSAAWINDQYVKRGWSAGRRGVDPYFETDIKDFEEKVVRPLDAAWLELTAEERASSGL